MMLQFNIVLLVLALAIFNFNQLVGLAGKEGVEFGKAKTKLFGEQDLLTAVITAKVDGGVELKGMATLLMLPAQRKPLSIDIFIDKALGSVTVTKAKVTVAITHFPLKFIDQGGGVHPL